MNIDINKVKDLISKNKLSEAIALLSTELKTIPNWLIQLKGRLDDLKTRETTGILDQSDEIILLNQLRLDLLNAIEQFVETDSISQLKSTTTFAAKSFIQNGDVYVAFTDGSEKRLTFNGLDEWSALRKMASQVIFVRLFEYGSGRKKIHYRHLMSVDIHSLEETLIADIKPYRDGLDAEYRIFHISFPFLSEDEQFLYFVCERYATGMALFELNLTTKEWLEIAPAHYLKVIQKGSMKGYFAVETSENRRQGRQWYPMIIDRKGKILKEFTNRDVLDDFLNS